MRGSLLVAGTTSDAGKSVVVAGICRHLARQGVRVAPFKAQNMSNNSMVTPDGSEIGRAQAMQAAAAGVAPEAAMNPVLLKPGSDRRSHVVLMGSPVTDTDALGYRGLKPRLFEAVLAAYQDLKSRYDVVVCEGAGSPAEINLRATDIANMGLARALGLPVIVVGDIDRGGVFAAFHGTVALLDAGDQRLISGFVVNRFRGDPALLAPGLDQIRALTGRPVLGTLPHLPDLHLDAEDSLALDRAPDRRSRPPLGRDALRIAVIRLPRISNFTDIDALAAEPGVELTFATTPGALAGADLVVLPGTRATVADLAWLRGRGLDAALAGRAAAGGPVFGICGGYQMLGRSIDDPEHVESPSGHVDGLGLLPVRTEFAVGKTLTRPHGVALGEPVEGYEIHHGCVAVEGGEPFVADGAGVPLDGCRVGPVAGTLWHGVCENDAFRRALLGEVAAATGRAFVPSQDTNFAALRESQLDRLADAVAAHVDTDALARLIEHGPPADLPLLWPGATPSS